MPLGVESSQCSIVGIVSIYSSETINVVASLLLAILKYLTGSYTAESCLVPNALAEWLASIEGLIADTLRSSTCTTFCEMKTWQFARDQVQMDGDYTRFSGRLEELK